MYPLRLKTRRPNSRVQFTSLVQIPDPDALISVFKTCLRTSNQHLTTATLSALPALLPLIIAKPGAQNQPQSVNPSRSVSSSTSSLASSLIDAHILRQCLIAFLPTGGVLDRLGDTREKAREKAKETLVVLGGLAFRGGGGSSISSKSKPAETPMLLFERHLREGGLASKVWRVREQVRVTFRLLSPQLIPCLSSQS